MDVTYKRACELIYEIREVSDESAEKENGGAQLTPAISALRHTL